MAMTRVPEGIPIPVQWSEDRRAIHLLDQTLLPGEERYLRLETVEEVAEAITSLRVRGAPAIGITVALALAMGARQRAAPGASENLDSGLESDLARLLSTRPTAVNLAWAAERMRRVFEEATHQDEEAQAVALVQEADTIAAEDRTMCALIGEHGLAVIPSDGAGILTHCNAGALATGGRGTALAPVYAAHSRGIPVSVFADETRPLLQGARLTAWELQRAGVPVTVVTDSMAGALMAAGRVNLVLVGADRVAANGDVANKIGTYGLAVLAHHHGIPFFVALPRSTFDRSTPKGGTIPIEERDPAEIVEWKGHVVVPEGVQVWNPAFDITPAHLVTAFVTDGGILRPPYEAAIARLCTTQGSAATPSGPSREGGS
jgi:methylthioribose-1-phosphate isomerase